MLSLGRIVRLQIQLDRLKTGIDPHRVYDPAPIREVPRLWIRPEGIVAEAPGGGFLIDVHHRTHPRSRNRDGANGISFGFLSACAEVRDRFSEGLWDGIAGESLLLDGSRPRPEELRNGVLIRKETGAEWRLQKVVPADPCVPFARFVLGRPKGPVEPAEQKEALQFLMGGRRGFYAVFQGPDAVLLEPGDVLFALD